MKPFSAAETLLFNTIIKVYKVDSALALSCINEKNVARFEEYVQNLQGDRSSYILQEIQEINKVRRKIEIESNDIRRR